MSSAVLTDASAGPGDAACNALTEQDAAALMGAPLESNFRNESKPDAMNGHDHTTVCGWFPKGYDLKKADAPPEYEPFAFAPMRPYDWPMPCSRYAKSPYPKRRPSFVSP